MHVSCSVPGCARFRVWRVILALKSGPAHFQAPLKIWTNDGVCERHRVRVGPEDFLNVALWAIYSTEATAAGHRHVERRLTEILFMRLTEMAEAPRAVTPIRRRVWHKPQGRAARSACA